MTNEEASVKFIVTHDPNIPGPDTICKRSYFSLILITYIRSEKAKHGRSEARRREREVYRSIDHLLLYLNYKHMDLLSYLRERTTHNHVAGVSCVIDVKSDKPSIDPATAKTAPLQTPRTSFKRQ